MFTARAESRRSLSRPFRMRPSRGLLWRTILSVAGETGRGVVLCQHFGARPCFAAKFVRSRVTRLSPTSTRLTLGLGITHLSDALRAIALLARSRERASSRPRNEGNAGTPRWRRCSTIRLQPTPNHEADHATMAEYRGLCLLLMALAGLPGRPLHYSLSQLSDYWKSSSMRGRDIFPLQNPR